MDNNHVVITIFSATVLAIFIAMKIWSANRPVSPMIFDRSAFELLNENLWINRLLNVLVFLCLLVGLFFYQSGWFRFDDWRGLGLSFGLSALLPLIALVFLHVRRGLGAIKEGLAIWAFSNETSPLVQNSVLFFFLFLGIASLVSLYERGMP